MSSADVYIVMTWLEQSAVTDDPEPDEFVYTMSGDLFDVDEDGERHIAGKFTVYYVDVERAVNEGVSVYDVMDAHSRTTAEYYDALFSEGSNFSEKLLDLLRHDIAGSNLLILDRLELLPRYRGRMLGLRVIRHMIERFSAGAGIVAIKPFPLQYEVEPREKHKKKWRSDLELVEFPGDEQAGTNRLRTYYGALGFVPVNGSPFMVRSTAWQLPSLQQE